MEIKPGDLVTNRNRFGDGKMMGLFLGLREFDGGKWANSYVCAEVMWFNKPAPNGNPISTIQLNLITKAIDE